MSLVPISFESETDIRCELQAEVSEESRRPLTLIAKFSGTYRHGSAGSPDAQFICGIARTAIAMWCPEAMIVDLRELSYTWGDKMDEILCLSFDRPIPVAIVVGESCLPAIGTLLYGEGSDRPATDVENIFDNLDEAWGYVHRKE